MLGHSCLGYLWEVCSWPLGQHLCDYTHQSTLIPGVLLLRHHSIFFQKASALVRPLAFRFIHSDTVLGASHDCSSVLCIGLTKHFHYKDSQVSHFSVSQQQMVWIQILSIAGSPSPQDLLYPRAPWSVCRSLGYNLVINGLHMCLRRACWLNCSAASYKCSVYGCSALQWLASTNLDDLVQGFT